MCSGKVKMKSFPFLVWGMCKWLQVWRLRHWKAIPILCKNCFWTFMWNSEGDWCGSTQHGRIPTRICEHWWFGRWQSCKPKQKCSRSWGPLLCGTTCWRHTIYLLWILARSEMRVIHEWMKRLLWSLGFGTDSEFLLITATSTKHKCFQKLVSYSYDIPEGKDVSGVWHGMSSRRPFMRCLTTTDDVRIMGWGPVRRLVHTLDMRDRVRKLAEASEQCLREKRRGDEKALRKECNAILFKRSMLKRESFLETSSPVGYDGVLDMYALFSFERLDNLHLEISKLSKDCTF